VDATDVARHACPDAVESDDERPMGDSNVRLSSRPHFPSCWLRCVAGKGLGPGWDRTPRRAHGLLELRPLCGLLVEVWRVWRNHAEYKAAGIDHLPVRAIVVTPQPLGSEGLQAPHFSVDVVSVDVEMDPWPGVVVDLLKLHDDLATKGSE
jgi:hypothetical protein